LLWFFLFTEEATKGSSVMKKFLVLAVLSVLLLPATPALCGTMIDRIIAVVGQDTIKLSELQSEMAPALADLEQRMRGDELAHATDRLKRSTLNNLIDKYLQLQEARIQGIDVTDEEVTSAIDDIMQKNKMDKATFVSALENEGYAMEDYRKSIGDQLRMLRLVSRAVKSKISVSEDEVKDYYAKNSAKFAEPETIKVANIMFPVKEGGMEAALKKAQDARSEIMSGKPFEEAAAECTGDPNTAKTCVLGTFGRGEMSKDIEEKAFSMNAGDISEPVQSEFGYQLIKVMEKKGSDTKTLQDVRGQVVEELSAQKGQAIFAKWVQELRKHTYVEIRELP